MKEYPEILYFLIAAGGGVLRYLSNLITKKIIWNVGEFVVWFICSGMLGILAGRIAPKMSDEKNIQYAIIYVTGMLSIEFIKIIVHYIPSHITKQLPGK